MILHYKEMNFAGVKWQKIQFLKHLINKFSQSKAIQNSSQGIRGFEWRQRQGENYQKTLFKCKNVQAKVIQG